MSRSLRSSLVGFILLFGFFARAATYKAPLLDHHGWRQADTASIARNFSREQFNILYPQVDQRGAQVHGYVETGLEVLAFVAAAIARLSRFDPAIGRLLSACCFIGSGAVVWAFTRRRYGDEIALVAVFLQAFGFPLMLFMDRAFMNEALLVLLSLCCLLAAQRRLAAAARSDIGALEAGHDEGEHRGSRTALAVLVAASALVGLVKLPYLIIWGAVVGLYVEDGGWRALRRPDLWLMAVVDVAAAGWWYWHAHALAATTGLSFGLTDKLFAASEVFTLHFPALMIARLFRDILEPVGFVAFVAGAWLALKQRRFCELFGIASFVAYLAIVAVGNIVHDYYQIALMPIAAIVAAPGLVWMADLVARSVPARRAPAIAVLLALAATSTFVRLASAHSWFEYADDAVLACRELQRSTRSEDRVLLLGDNNPMLLFCADRKGWALSQAESDPAHVRAILDQHPAAALTPRDPSFEEVRTLIASRGRLLPTSGETFNLFRLQ